MTTVYEGECECGGYVDVSQLDLSTDRGMDIHCIKCGRTATVKREGIVVRVTLREQYRRSTDP